MDRLRAGEAQFTVRKEADGVRVVPAEGESRHVDARSSGSDFLVDGRRGYAARAGSTVWVRYGGRTYRFERVAGGRRSAGDAAGGDMAAPMPGQVVQLLVEEGAVVEAGEPLLVVEAMKMQLEIKAAAAGTVRRFPYPVGAQVAAGVPLVELDPS